MCALSIFLPNIPGAWFTSEIFTVFASQPHLMFSRISALLTTYISVERYLCVWLPLKVKHIITPKRTFVAMVTLFALPFAFNLHLSLSFPVGWKFYPEKNKTLLGLLPVKSQFIVVIGQNQADSVLSAASSDDVNHRFVLHYSVSIGALQEQEMERQEQSCRQDGKRDLRRRVRSNEIQRNPGD